MTPTEILNRPLPLPCGAVLPNRLAKAAMTEGIADAHNRATARHERLYRLWSEGGAGLLLTGNIQIDRQHLEAAGNVVIDAALDAEALAALRRYAASATAAGNHAWVQLAHAGRQTPIAINTQPKAPSAIQVALPGNRFGVPVPMPADEIARLPARFAAAAQIAREAGFTGVQLHAAHGYLLSSFLSPRANRREDAWGGSLESRARVLLEAVRATRTAVGADFPVSVKLNSADFQRGGFSAEDSLTVARWLDGEGIDLLEISGGSYEQPAMMKLAGLEAPEPPRIAASTRAREAYFQAFAPTIRAAVTRAKLMVTGGFRTAAGMADAIETDGVDVIGLGRPLCVDPAAPGGLLRGDIAALGTWETRLRAGPGWLGPNSPIAFVKMINGFGMQSWFYEQLKALADRGTAERRLGLLPALVRAQRREAATVQALQRN